MINKINEFLSNPWIFLSTVIIIIVIFNQVWNRYVLPKLEFLRDERVLKYSHLSKEEKVKTLNAIGLWILIITIIIVFGWKNFLDTWSAVVEVFERN